MLERHGLNPRKSLGQNFVVDDQVIEQIVKLAQIGTDSSVLEVGPGLGALTTVLAASARRVVAVEKDASLVPLLRNMVEDHGTVEIIAGDALAVDWSQLLNAAEDWVLIANLPYNVSVPVIMSVLASAPMVGRGIVMVQQEVAERLAADPGGRTIGVPSIGLAWYATAKVLAVVPPEVFYPVPNVSSALLELRRHGPPSDQVSVNDVMKLVGPAYRKRRKMLRSSIAHLAPPDVLTAAGVDPTSRPETLSLADWVAIAEQVADS